jgi:hypothetical protein
MWPVHPPDDLEAGICAALVFGIGLAVISARGARVINRE